MKHETRPCLTLKYSAGSQAEMPAAALPVQAPEHRRTIPALEAASRVNLKMMFPVSFRYTIQRSAGIAAAFSILLSLYIYFYGVHGLFHPGSELNVLGASCLAVLGLVLMGKIFYQELYRHSLQYETDGFRLVITRGVLFKNEGSLPLLPVSEIYVKRDFSDFLFGLYDVNVATPVNAARAFGLIHGLTFEDAHALQAFLSKQLNRQIFISEKADA